MALLAQSFRATLPNDTIKFEPLLTPGIKQPIQMWVVIQEWFKGDRIELESESEDLSVWSKADLKAKLNHWNDDWREIINDLKKSTCKRNIWVVVKKIVFAATIYFMWQEIVDSSNVREVCSTWEIKANIWERTLSIQGEN
ncbi:hypothetical protein Tco_0991101 [Tanacetum coccineum]|uniref:Reverse transcriptase zinc-binding domain-containing protein n=1 Tax=Tanacetum coccineum TaxID=301880 RepID=A0ABQ5EZQ1_9ASTR